MYFNLDTLQCLSENVVKFDRKGWSFLFFFVYVLWVSYFITTFFFERLNVRPERRFSRSRPNQCTSIATSVPAEIQNTRLQGYRVLKTYYYRTICDCFRSKTRTHQCRFYTPGKVCDNKTGATSTVPLLRQITVRVTPTVGRNQFSRKKPRETCVAAATRPRQPVQGRGPVLFINCGINVSQKRLNLQSFLLYSQPNPGPESACPGGPVRNIGTLKIMGSPR